MKKNTERRKLYITYLNSIEWEQKRKLVLELHHNKCQKCNTSSNLQVHHWTYVRLFKEELGDLFCLCKDCHTELHKPYWTKDLLRVTKCFISWKEYIPKPPRVKKIKTKEEKVASWKKKQNYKKNKKKKERKLLINNSWTKIRKRKELPPKPPEYYSSFKWTIVLKKWKLWDPR